MSEAHVIEHLRAEADIRGANVEEAEGRWSAWLRGPGLQLLDDLLDECYRDTCEPGDVWTLHSLTLDLGVVDGPAWEEAWSRQLRQALTDALDTQRGPAGARRRPAGVRSRMQSRLSLLLYFLRHGRLPWQARGEDPRLLAQELLQRDPAALVGALRQQEDRALLVRRLVLQFDRTWLASLVQALMPGRPASAQRLLAMVAAHGLHGQAPSGMVSLWEVVLDEALSAEGDQRSAPLPRARAQLKAALAAGAHFSAGTDPLLALGDAWQLLLREDAAWLRDTLQTAGRQDGQRQRLARALPAELLPQMLTLWMGDTLRGEIGRWIEAVATAVPASTSETGERRQWLWQATLDHALRGETAAFEPTRYTAHVRQHLHQLAPTGAQAPQRWFDRVVSGATAMLCAAAQALRLRWRPRQEASDTAAEALRPMAAEDTFGDPMAVANAGLVLISPYLPKLFQMVGLADAKGFKDAAAALRGAVLLEALVTDAPPEDGATRPLRQQAVEHTLSLNKLLCGLPLDEPLPREWTLTTDERQAIEGLLGAVVQHWRVLGATSINGLRQTFLRRAGTLRPEQDGWRLAVEPGAFDMLIDHLPWGYTVVKFGWMERVLHVDWR
ncbi:hypothetical protein SAMN05216359_10897 [Roseateles sp. YR242]|uniref:contractile injection system tape measure protein n=1 Tax=Roseateles sp. YR242 TaxID=1855305 RepID=UPI0008B38F9E|nr:contractile injection system tape measure protein [Roseateles sp. YR242]SEL37837.1 hypothetical protein SAMN05216359_10897 [Roseateles sp. YR242]